MFSTYTTAHGNAGSLTPLSEAGTEPTSSWILVGFVSSAPQGEPQEIKHFRYSQSPSEPCTHTLPFLFAWRQPVS